MHGDRSAFIACARTAPRVVQNLHSKTLEVSNSRSPEVLDKDGYINLGLINSRCELMTPREIHSGGLSRFTFKNS